MRWLAHVHHFSTRDYGAARTWYEACVAFDGERHDCGVFLAKLSRDEGKVGEASTTAFDEMAKAAKPEGGAPHLKMVDNFYVARRAPGADSTSLQHLCRRPAERRARHASSSPREIQK